MRFPWANTLLLALIAVELVSGFFGLVSGSPDEAIFILAHRIAGWGIVAVPGVESRERSGFPALAPGSHAPERRLSCLRSR